MNLFRFITGLSRAADVRLMVGTLLLTISTILAKSAERLGLDFYFRALRTYEGAVPSKRRSIASLLDSVEYRGQYLPDCASGVKVSSVVIYCTRNVD